ncbi:DICT sensory domain-containing protein [uncultured Nocardioides sp.]|uniref:DICT sensory domain-containing protein n=1 Tax=uncultured Nocardioides sp. TaxID=198441 RepID=UPI00345DE307
MPDASPFASLSRHQTPRASPKRALLSLSRSIEARALASAPQAQLWVSLQHVRFHAGLTRRLHEQMARAGVEVHVYGVGIRDGRPVRCCCAGTTSPSSGSWPRSGTCCW